MPRKSGIHTGPLICEEGYDTHDWEGNSSHVGCMLQVAVRLRPLNAREVAQGETEAVTVSHEDPHSLDVRVVHPRMLRQQPFAFSMR
jgi:hypothetical protein